MQKSPMMAGRDAPQMLEKGANAVAGLEKILEEAVFTRKEQGFRKSLLSLKDAISGMLQGTVPDFRKYDRNAIGALVSRNHEIRLSLMIEDGKPSLCPEMESSISALLYTMGEHDSGRISLRIGKESGGGRQVMLISGSGMKNFAPLVVPAVQAAVELMGCEFRPNGTSVTILVPLRQDGVPLAI